jgi:hypothetical protein
MENAETDEVVSSYGYDIQYKGQILPDVSNQSVGRAWLNEFDCRLLCLPDIKKKIGLTVNVSG